MLSSRGWRVTCALVLSACSVAHGLETQEKTDAERVPALIEALKVRHYYTRQSAAVALGRIGPAAAEAVPALSRAMEDKDSGVRAKAESALRKIAPDAPALLRLDRSRRRRERAQARMRWLTREVWKIKEQRPLFPWDLDISFEDSELGIPIWLIFLLLGTPALILLAIAAFRRFTRVRRMWVFWGIGSALAALQYVAMIAFTGSIKGVATPWVIISAVPYLTGGRPWDQPWFFGPPSLGTAVATAAVPLCAGWLYYLGRYLRPKDI